MPDPDRRLLHRRPRDVVMTASREDLSRRLEAGAKAIDHLLTRVDLDAGGPGLLNALVELAAALRSEAGLALGRPSLVNLHLVRVADALVLGRG